LVADIIASGGSQDPALGTRLFWGILEGILASVLLLAGGLVALQTGSITIGLPFCVIIILMCASLARGLNRELAGKVPADQFAYIHQLKRNPKQKGFDNRNRRGPRGPRGSGGRRRFQKPGERKPKPGSAEAKRPS
jgi:choline-glycine betaine transporter